MTETGEKVRSARRRMAGEYGRRMADRAARMASRAAGQGETPETLRALARDGLDETSTCLRLAAELCEARAEDERKG